MGKAWVKDRKKDPYYRAAKRQQLRSRAAFKLVQIQERFAIIREGWTVLDLGAAPGGWSQVAKSFVGDEGSVFAVDIVGMSPIEGVKLLRGDLRDMAFVQELIETMGVVDVVLSDMAPRLSGNKSYDHARAMELAGIALDVAGACLRDGGNLVAKAFSGEDFDPFLKRVKRMFDTARASTPPASTKGSAEVYIVAKGFKRSAPRPD